MQNSNDSTFDTSLRATHFHPRYWGSWLAIFLLYLLAWVPPRWRDRIADGVAPWVIRLSEKPCYIARTNLAICFPELSEAEREALLLKSVRVGLKSFIAFGELSARSSDYLVSRCEIRGWEHFEAAKATGQGIIMVVPHTWAIDACGRLFETHCGLTMATMMKSARNPVFDRYINQERARNGARVYERSVGLKPAIRTLKDGGGFYYLPDEDLGAENSIFVPFFGKDKATLPALPKLCKVAKAKALMLLAAYDEDVQRYRLTIEPFPEPYPSGDLINDTLVMNQLVERLLHQAPEQYMWFLKVFQTQQGTRTRFYDAGLREIRNRRQGKR